MGGRTGEALCLVWRRIRQQAELSCAICWERSGVKNMGMKSFLRVMQYEIHRDEKEINNNNEWIGQQSLLVSPTLKHDGKSVKDDRSRVPLVDCHMHLLPLKRPSRQHNKVFLYLFLLGRTIQVMDKVHMKFHCFVEKCSCYHENSLWLHKSARPHQLFHKKNTVWSTPAYVWKKDGSFHSRILSDGLAHYPIKCPWILSSPFLHPAPQNLHFLHCNQNCAWKEEKSEFEQYFCLYYENIWFHIFSTIILL